ncbi:MAG: potassium transporter TrkG [Bacteroidales bacterium]
MHIDLGKLLTFGYNSQVPQRNIAAGYLSYIIFGFIFLSLPWSQKTDVSIIDNLFIVTSAISTTGLTSIDIGTSYTLFGQIIILLMIQVGGLGYMTITSFILYQMTHHFMRIKNGIMKATFSIPDEFDFQGILKAVIIFTTVFEVGGTFLLYIYFYQAGIEAPLWNAAFHSISAFCTAGFSLFKDNLMSFDTNWGVNLVIAVLCIAGALGFIVMVDIRNKFTIKGYRFTFTTKVIFFMTFLFILVGTAQLYFFEPSFKSYEPSERALVSFFQTMSALSTAGYNTVDIGKMILPSLLTLTMAMFIGASPSGTGGGVRVTTIFTVFAYLLSKLGEKRDVEIASQRLPSYRVDTALTNFIFYTMILFGASYLLSFSEIFTFPQIVFEVASSLGTVGLSTGITAQFTIFGKIVLIVLMYIGRLGVVAFGTAMLSRMSKKIQNSTCNANDIAV